MTVPARTVLYCSFGPASNSGYFTALSRLVRSIGERLGAAVECASLEGSRFTTKQLRVFHPLDTHLMLRNIYLRAQRGDVGAVVIGNIQDPGLYEARLACTVPVVGLLESAVTAVRPFGASVGLLASSAPTVPLLRERLRQYQASDIVASIEVCGPELGTWGQAFTSAGGAVRGAGQCPRGRRARGGGRGRTGRARVGHRRGAARHGLVRRRGVDCASGTSAAAQPRLHLDGTCGHDR